MPRTARIVLVAFPLLVSLLMARPGSPRAQEIRIGIGATATTLDPHFHNVATNNTVLFHVFDRLVHRAPDGSLIPGLALSWKAVEPTVWEFKLRPGVRWHDDTPFTADDVAFSITRAPRVPNSPGGYGNYLALVTRADVVDPLTIRLHTRIPAPVQPIDLTLISIVSRRHGETASTRDYNSGQAMIGTGAYRFARYMPGERVELVRNDAWWGPAAPWQRVEMRFIPNPGARTAALLSGAVDLIDTPAPADLPRITADARFAISSRQGMRIIFLRPDFSHPVNAPYVFDDAGNALDRNPLMDVRVRTALSLAIDRASLTRHVQQNAAVPTGQWLLPGAFGYDPDIKVPAHEPEAARRLLAEAGYPNGFGLVLHTPNDRFPNDAATAQAVAQMWTRVGVRTRVEALPFSVLATRMARQDFSMVLFGWASASGEAGSVLQNLISTHDPSRRRGLGNTARYSNPVIDALTDKALATMQDAPREVLLRQAVGLAMRDVAFIPLYNQVNSWAFRADLVYPARADERTFAFEARPAR